MGRGGEECDRPPPTAGGRGAYEKPGCLPYPTRYTRFRFVGTPAPVPVCHDHLCQLTDGLLSDFVS
jgi:hypothetical protein